MTGIFILSLDTEIAWGTYGHAATLARAAAFDTYRETLRRLIALLDVYSIPATWAVVGHLFLNSAESADVPTPHYAWSAEPDSTRAPNPAHPDWYYGPDVIAAIQSANMPHEIGTHTFTHILADAVSADIWHAQMAKTLEVHAAHGLTLRSLVYPQDRVAYVDTLSQYGITSYRGVEQNWYQRIDGPLSRACHLVDRSLGLPPPTYDLSALREGDIVNLPASQFLMTYDGIRARIPTASRVRQARLGLDSAIRHNRLYHLWFHPFNLGQGVGMFAALEQILQNVAQHRDTGDLQVMTMVQCAESILHG